MYDVIRMDQTTKSCLSYQDRYHSRIVTGVTRHMLLDSGFALLMVGLGLSKLRLLARALLTRAQRR